jgi:hypothetical protein
MTQVWKPSAIKFTVFDQNYEFDFDDLTLQECEQIHARTGLQIWEFAQGVINGHPGAIRGMIVLAKKRAGERVEWNDPELGRLKIAPVTAQLADAFMDQARAVIAASQDVGDGDTAALLAQVEADLEKAEEIVAKKPRARKPKVS